MKAEELMIGDWVYGLYPNGERYASPFRISAVDIYPTNRSPRIVTMGGYGFQSEHLEPIPLTAEILEKNGWIKASGYWVLKGYSTRLGWRSGEMVIGYAALPEKILYVHELQNLMKAVKISCNFEI